jgi:hypothetical protein
MCTHLPNFLACPHPRPSRQLSILALLFALPPSLAAFMLLCASSVRVHAVSRHSHIEMTLIPRSRQQGSPMFARRPSLAAARSLRSPRPCQIRESSTNARRAGEEDDDEGYRGDQVHTAAYLPCSTLPCCTRDAHLPRLLYSTTNVWLYTPPLFADWRSGHGSEPARCKVEAPWL